MLPFSFRQIRTFLAVQEKSSVTAASRYLCHSQTSVTKSIQDLEQRVGAPLFDRTAKGMSLTAYGHCLLPWAEEAAAAFQGARALVSPSATKLAQGANRFFGMDVSDKWITAFLATAERQNFVSAAASLGVSAAAVSASVHKLEESLAVPLFERVPHVVVPTAAGAELVRFVKLAISHLRHAQDELSSMKGVSSGRVTIGTLPLLRTVVVPRAILRLVNSHSYIDVSTLEGHYEALVAALRCGDIDFIVGALRGLPEREELTEETLFEDPLSVIARKGHPLDRKRKVHWDEIVRYGWVLPRTGTPTRTLFEQAIFRRGLPIPQHVIETSSLVTLRGLLLESDRITVLSRHQIQVDERHGMLTALPFDLKEARRPIGITRRAHSTLSPAAELLINEIREVAREVAAGPR